MFDFTVTVDSKERNTVFIFDGVVVVCVASSLRNVVKAVSRNVSRSSRNGYRITCSVVAMAERSA